jgi:hypothetical protein
MQGKVGQRLMLLVGLLSASALVTVPAGIGAGATIVRGDQLIAGSQNCPNADSGTYRMAGDLVGCWYTDTFVVENENPGGGFKASGTEHFVGCLDTSGNGSCAASEPSGRFDTTFIFTAKFAPTGEEIHGRCHHPIVGGTGAFTGAKGGISFKDIPSEGRFPYHGEIMVGGQPLARSVAASSHSTRRVLASSTAC